MADAKKADEKYWATKLEESCAEDSAAPGNGSEASEGKKPASTDDPEPEEWSGLEDELGGDNKEGSEIEGENEDGQETRTDPDLEVDDVQTAIKKNHSRQRPATNPGTESKKQRRIFEDWGRVV